MNNCLSVTIVLGYVRGSISNDRKEFLIYDNSGNYPSGCFV
jgi:hypothetical protein